MEIYPSSRSDGYTFEILETDPGKSGHIDISKPGFPMGKNGTFPFSTIEIAGGEPTLMLQEPPWAPVVPKLENLAKKAQKRH